MGHDTLLAEARSWIGRTAMPDQVARDPVNLPMIRRWCDAMGEANPIYTDASAARAAGLPGIVAPPAMLDVWTMAPYRPGGRTDAESIAVLRLFDAAGYSGVVATNVAQRYDRYLVPGDLISARATVADVSEEKRTALGIGHFVTLAYEFADAAGARVGAMEFRLFKFKPTRARPAEPLTETPPAPRHPRPAITHDNAFYWEGIARRKLLFQSFGGRLRHPPGPMDPETGALDFDIVEASGHGTIHSFAIVHQPQLPGFTYPLPVVLVELEEGVRMTANLLDADIAEIAIGRAVLVDFFEVEPGYLLPGFRLV